jgi:hypothetical protein
MFEPVTFGLAFLVAIAFHIYRRERRLNRMDDFDGGWRQDHPRVTTIIYSKHIKQKE